MSIIAGLTRKIVDSGLIHEESMLQYLAQAAELNEPIVTTLVKKKILSALTIAKLASREFGLPFLDLDVFDTTLLPQLNLRLSVDQSHMLPLLQRGDKLFLGVSDPSNVHFIEHIKFQTGLSSELIIVEEDKLAQHMEKSAYDQELTNIHGITKHTTTLDTQISLEAASSSRDDTPIVRFINKTLLDAISLGASDIHFEPYESRYRVRFRQDGILYEQATPPQMLAPRIAARIKVLAQLDISERRIPQDGRFKMRISKNKSIDFRVSSCPTLFGEKIVIRILDPTSAQVGIDELGFTDFQKELFLKAIHAPQGMVIVTGPTGSGKTVTLYTALNILNVTEKNISAAEDPVEIYLPGVNQINVKPKIGLTFSAALKAFLRQDPDIIMVGEIRDVETAEIAVKAAQTGHMVLSTLHTNSAADTLTRMINMGVPSYNLANSVTLVVAQRLARRLCNSCKEEMDVPLKVKLDMGFSEVEAKELILYRPIGCKNCKGGYKGRVGLYEVMPISAEIVTLILEQANAVEIRRQAIKEGVWNIRQSGLNKIKQGITTFDEVYRVSTE